MNFLSKVSHQCQSLLPVWKHSQVWHTRSKIKLNYHHWEMLCDGNICESARGVLLNLCSSSAKWPSQELPVTRHPLWSGTLCTWSLHSSFKHIFSSTSKPAKEFSWVTVECTSLSLKFVLATPAETLLLAPWDHLLGNSERLYLEDTQLLSHATFCCVFLLQSSCYHKHLCEDRISDCVSRVISHSCLLSTWSYQLSWKENILLPFKYW